MAQAMKTAVISPKPIPPRSSNVKLRSSAFRKYHDAYLVCDYRWKRASADTYTSTGRLLAFFLERTGASWSASLEVLARSRPGATDAEGRPIDFALVDLEVAPDGSWFLSDHNQGLWRML